MKPAVVLIGGAAALALFGFALELVPEDNSLGEYGIGDVFLGVVVLGLAGAVVAAKTAGQGEDRRVTAGLVIAGVVPAVIGAALLLLVVTLCATGNCN